MTFALLNFTTVGAYEGDWTQTERQNDRHILYPVYTERIIDCEVCLYILCYAE